MAEHRRSFLEPTRRVDPVHSQATLAILALRRYACIVGPNRDLDTPTPARRLLQRSTPTNV